MKKRLFTIGAMSVLSGVVQAQDESSGYRQAAASVTKTVTVSATANGNFGSCSSNGPVLTKTISVVGAGTLLITANGTWCTNDSYCYGPNGAAPDWFSTDVLPLQQVVGVPSTAGGGVNNLMALMGAFVPKSVVDTAGFRAVDGTKITGLGIMPNQLFFVGRNNYLQVSGSGTLYLGTNDCGHFDNSGNLSVQIRFTPN